MVINPSGRPHGPARLESFFLTDFWLSQLYYSVDRGDVGGTGMVTPKGLGCIIQVGGGTGLARGEGAGGDKEERRRAYNQPPPGQIEERNKYYREYYASAKLYAVYDTP